MNCPRNLQRQPLNFRKVRVMPLFSACPGLPGARRVLGALAAEGQEEHQLARGVLFRGGENLPPFGPGGSPFF